MLLCDTLFYEVFVYRLLFMVLWFFMTLFGTSVLWPGYLFLSSTTHSVYLCYLFSNNKSLS